MEESIEIECATVKRISSDIIIVKYKKDYDVHLKDAKEVDKTYTKLIGNNRIYSILDSTDQHTYFKKDAQKYLADEGETVQKLIASLIVLNGLPTRILTRFFVRFLKPPYVVKIFKTVDEAMDRIATHKTKNRERNPIIEENQSSEA